ncbi:hypothetical protein [Paenibacillus sp. CF384]|uniref:hypothetical protein n=1 Tax=Paenibacillus sp. CF384 TaxID=1884382 RepID=UPI00089B51A5|nr:hypothetical protein [Paenibacillus sp. CF384]SDX96413.1 type IV pilus assembly protein PilO [Paenibacillus sp. CF384]
MEQLTKNRSLTVLLLALLFLVLFVIYTYLLKPSTDKIANQQIEIESLNNQYSLLSNKLAEKKKASDEYSKSAVQLALPLWDNTEQLLLDLQQIESVTGTETLTASFTPDLEEGQSIAGENSDTNEGTTDSINPLGPNVKKLKVASVIKGSYSNVLRYIEELQKLPRLITVDSFDVAKTGSINASSKPISANIVYTAYFDPSYKPLVKETILPFEEK